MSIGIKKLQELGYELVETYPYQLKLKLADLDVFIEIWSSENDTYINKYFLIENEEENVRWNIDEFMAVAMILESDKYE